MTTFATASAGAPAAPRLSAICLNGALRRARPDRRLDRPGLDDRDVDAERAQLDAQGIGDGLERVLRRGIGGEERQRAAAGDRAHEDDPAARSSQRRQARLGDGDLPYDVHLELVTQLL